ncbi:MAG: hypothetical protein GY822_29820 [Deltaproteobacteria bacterium]|nr:hypothetical protein [Deltaproteobacteria bacterium]
MMISRLLYEQLPRKTANELVLLGERAQGQRAREMGLVNKVVSQEEVCH